jgi:DNA-binding MarR family transcriptional regulator
MQPTTVSPVSPLAINVVKAAGAIRQTLTPSTWAVPVSPAAAEVLLHMAQRANRNETSLPMSTAHEALVGRKNPVAQASIILKQLEDAGYINVRKSPTDRRARTISFTRQTTQLLRPGGELERALQTAIAAQAEPLRALCPNLEAFAWLQIGDYISPFVVGCTVFAVGVQTSLPWWEVSLKAHVLLAALCEFEANVPAATLTVGQALKLAFGSQPIFNSTAMIDTLCEAELLTTTRPNGNGDRRTVHLAVTEEGRVLYAPNGGFHLECQAILELIGQTDLIRSVEAPVAA